ncbi:MAG TPA: alpha-1,4-glucan--maltose-1-phosphate maltosyltransferase [Lentisphaeria bacterium]|nr:MAG: hypothetical protein A2X47_02335 [Lentisphaerae bacterium GWF2_38_69]HBM17142.1 alpha-1,4-glucan--maltose-1-phosphate maltosyltransferase [Lentisphaeria bacterium]
MKNDKIILLDITPQVEEGRFPIKLAVDEPLEVHTRYMGDYANSLVLKIRKEQSSTWMKIPMISCDDNLWFAKHFFTELGMYRYTVETDSAHPYCYPIEIPVWVELSRIRYSTWYQRFPRSCSDMPCKHATFKEFHKELQRIATMGFDTIYIPPIHPIGVTNRKGKNGTLSSDEKDIGSVWAVGNQLGGHKAIDPLYGSLDDFSELILHSKKMGVEIAFDITFHCSPDHPYIMDHPEWFLKDSDGQFLYVQDGNVDYRDVVPFDFNSFNKQDLWNELKSVVEFWINLGISVFRIDNPHTKPVSFWEWLLYQIKLIHPEVIFLSEALTTPDRMYQLAKIGMSQSYDYFQWKTSKTEIESYYSEIYSRNISSYFMPVLWTNTPQNLPLYLQNRDKDAFLVRLILACTLGASYGIYGPPFEYCMNESLENGSIEYKDSEQFEIPDWNTNRKYPISDIIQKLNLIRLQNSALQNNWSLKFHNTDNANVIAYSKHSADFMNIIIVIVNLTPEIPQNGFVYLDTMAIKLADCSSFSVYDLLYDNGYLWNNSKNYFEFTPDRYVTHVLLVGK